MNTPIELVLVRIQLDPSFRALAGALGAWRDGDARKGRIARAPATSKQSVASPWMRERPASLGGLSVLVHSGHLPLDLRDGRNHERKPKPPGSFARSASGSSVRHRHDCITHA